MSCSNIPLKTKSVLLLPLSVSALSLTALPVLAQGLVINPYPLQQTEGSVSAPAADTLQSPVEHDSSGAEREIVYEQPAPYHGSLSEVPSAPDGSDFNQGASFSEDLLAADAEKNEGFSPLMNYEPNDYELGVQGAPQANNMAPSQAPQQFVVKPKMQPVYSTPQPAAQYGNQISPIAITSMAASGTAPVNNMQQAGSYQAQNAPRNIMQAPNPAAHVQYNNNFQNQLIESPYPAFEGWANASANNQSPFPVGQTPNQFVGHNVQASHATTRDYEDMTTGFMAQNPPAQYGVQTWSAQPGDDIKSILQRWSNQESVEFIWAAGDGFEVIDPVTFKGNYEGAVLTLLEQYKGLNWRPVGSLHVDPADGTRALVIQISQS